MNFNLRLATLAEPKHPWRILTSDRHSTVWDGRPDPLRVQLPGPGHQPGGCFELANEEELPVGKLLKVYYARHYTED